MTSARNGASEAGDERPELSKGDEAPISPSQSRAELLRTVRHDLRTPVNHVIGYSELLLEEAEDRECGAIIPDIQRIHGAGRQLLTLIDQALDVLNLENRKTDLALLRHEFRTPVNHIIGYSEMLLEEAMDQNFDWLLADLQRIHASGRSLLEMINDLLADSYIDGPGTRVSSEGLGSLPNDIDSLLATAQALLERKEPTTSDEVDYLLVVDDNEMNRDMLSRRLERLGYRVFTAEGGAQAISMVRLIAFDLILLDIMMPGMNGYQVLRQLKSDDKLRNIPVIVLSALDEIDSVVRCIKMGAEDHLPKPFDPVLLQARIGACLEKKRLRDQEVRYLQDVERLTAAAADVEQGAFVPDGLADVARRDDPLGQLARVFQRMAREVAAREQRLKQQVQELRIEIDETRKARQVAEITETDYFHSLQQKARRLRGQETPRQVPQPPTQNPDSE